MTANAPEKTISKERYKSSFKFTGNDCRTGGRCDANQVSNGYLKRYVVF